MGLNIEALREKLGKLSNKNKRSDIIWKPTEGSTNIRIVPLKENPENPFIELYFHYLGGRTQLSPLTFGKADPIAEFAESLRGGGHLPPDEWAETKKFVPVVRTYVPVIVRGQEDEGVRFWAFGKTIFKELLEFIDDEDYGDITHPKTGRDIKVTFTPKEKTENKTFPETKIRMAAKTSPISTDAAYLKKVLEDQPSIYDAYTAPTYEELQTFLERFLAPVVDAGDDDDDDDAEWEGPGVTSEDSESETIKAKGKTENFEKEFAEMFSEDD